MKAIKQCEWDDKVRAPGDEYYDFDQLFSDIEWMNNTFELEGNDTITDLGKERINKFIQVFKDEVDELKLVHVSDEDGDGNLYFEFDYVHLADTFGDLLVYLLSECRRWGIPIIPVFSIIMDSQESKLVDGKPLKAEDGSKFIKGPNYQPPEPILEAFLKDYLSGS